MITTVSLNPCIDKRIEVETFVPGGLNRVVNTVSELAGKGVNVSMTVSALGEEPCLVGFMSHGESGLFEDLFRDKKIRWEFIQRYGSLRTNIKVMDRTKLEVTELNEAGEPVTDEQLAVMTNLISRFAQESDYLILTGSVPPGCAPEYYGRIAESLRDSTCRCVLDADGPLLKYGVMGHPFMVKPNLYELERWYGSRLMTQKDILNAACKMVHSGAEWVVVSLGAGGAIMTNGRESYFSPAIEVSVQSTVGAGDAMLGGLVVGLSQKRPLSEVFAMGMACAALRCEAFRQADWNPRRFDELVNRVKLRRV